MLVLTEVILHKGQRGQLSDKKGIPLLMHIFEVKGVSSSLMLCDIHIKAQSSLGKVYWYSSTGVTIMANTYFVPAEKGSCQSKSYRFQEGNKTSQHKHFYGSITMSTLGLLLLV